VSVNPKGESANIYYTGASMEDGAPMGGAMTDGVSKIRHLINITTDYNYFP